MKLEIIETYHFGARRKNISKLSKPKQNKKDEIHENS